MKFNMKSATTGMEFNLDTRLLNAAQEVIAAHPEFDHWTISVEGSHESSGGLFSWLFG